MKRILAVLLLLLGFARPALAQAPGCIDLTYSWTTPYQSGSIQAVSYSIDSLYLMILFFTQNVELDVNVPLSVAQASTKTNVSADTWYNTQVKGRYQQAVLVEITACPLLNEATGQFITAG